MKTRKQVKDDVNAIKKSCKGVLMNVVDGIDVLLNNLQRMKADIKEMNDVVPYKKPTHNELYDYKDRQQQKEIAEFQIL